MKLALAFTLVAIAIIYSIALVPHARTYERRVFFDASYFKQERVRP